MTDLHARLARHCITLKALAGLAGGERINRVSTKNDRFTLTREDGTQADATFTLDAIIVDANPHASRQYYSKGYTPGAMEAPDCFSHNGVGPSERAQSPQAEQCVGCPMAKWGSAKSKMTGKDIAACSKRKLLAVVPITPELSQGKVTIYEFNLPVTALDRFDAYAKDLGRRVHASGARPFELFDVITTFSFDTGPNAKIGQLMFKEGATLNDAQLAFIADLLDTGETVKYVKSDDKPRQGVLAAPARQHALPASAPLQGEVLSPTPQQRVAAARDAAASRPARAWGNQAPSGLAQPAPAPAAAPTPFQQPAAAPEALGGLLGGLGFDMTNS